MIEVIGISGKAGSGKDFVGRTILRPAGYHQWAFAWPMKMLALGQGATYEDVFITKPPAVREMLQRIGTEEGWMVYGRDYWLKQADGWLRTLHENQGIEKFYFTDVRFPHEVDWIKSYGGKVVRLEHDGREYPLAGTPAAVHSSETALDEYNGWDAIVLNGPGATRGDLTAAMDPVLPKRYGMQNIEAWINETIPLNRGGQHGAIGRWQHTLPVA